MSKPLTPPDSDLQDFPFMPLHVARLRDSDLAAEESPEACWYAVLLWAAAWHQVPAGSLPDNDAVLTKLIGLGRDVRTFRKHKAGALRGFILCEDGRLYHPVVAEQVNAAWAEKLAYRERRDRRVEIARKAAEARWSNPDADADAKHDAMHDASEKPASCTADALLKGTGTGTGISSEDKSSDAAGVVSDFDRDAWRTAISLLVAQGRTTEAKARAFFGKLLSANGLEARDLLPAVTAALVNRTEDPQGYLTKSAAMIAKRRAGTPERRVDFV